MAGDCFLSFFFSPPNVFIYLKDTVTQRKEETERWREIQRMWGGRERDRERSPVCCCIGQIATAA